MTAPTFDTLSAVRRLREAGLDERTAGAVVEVLRRGPDARPEGPVSREDLEVLKRDMQQVRLELHADIPAVEKRLAEMLRVQGLAVVGGVAALVAIATAIIKLM